MKDTAWRNVAWAYPYLDVDARIWFFTDYYSISPGIISQIPGKGAKYMIAFTDSKGTPLSGGDAMQLWSGHPGRTRWRKRPMW